ncbi:hypothetical protein [Altererythrobacter sp.]|uniref:hypothetical protein n=1 Tax=Altererythrobacter sp. TaxID=1872480 RepID=UPI003D074E1F
MLEAQVTRSDSDLFATLPIEDEESLFDYLRPYLTNQEASLLGFSPANDEDDGTRSFVPSLLAGIAATVSTAVLFATVGFVSTLGLAEAGGGVAALI